MTLVLDCDLAEIPRLQKAVDGIFDAIPGNADARFGVQLALEELVTNVISHAYSGARSGAHSGKLWVDIRRSASCVTCRIEDQGPPFDPMAQSTPDVGLDIDDRNIGGLGIHFARESVDELTYARVGDRNVVLIIRRLDP